MRKVIPWLNDSIYIEPLSPACSMCAEGAKMVILATGLCSTNCFYCPLSFRKSGTDRIFTDEWELENETDIQKLIQEAKYIQATGAGITGGDPLLVWQRVQSYISILKDTFGKSFHIHLYTSGVKNKGQIGDLAAVGLDEIRFHPPPPFWNDMNNSPVTQSIELALDTGIDVAIEIPALPGKEDEIWSLIQWAQKNDIRWINLNELEFSEKNCDVLTSKGYEVKSDLSAAVQGSQDTAISVLNRIAREDFSVGVHYCSVAFKDGIQLRNRIKRRAQSIAKAYEVITEDGTLIKGVVIPSKETLPELLTFFHTTYDIPKEFLFIDAEKHRIETGAWILEPIAHELHHHGYTCYMVEEYPTADRLEVERTPLPV